MATMETAMLADNGLAIVSRMLVVAACASTIAAITHLSGRIDPYWFIVAGFAAAWTSWRMLRNWGVSDTLYVLLGIVFWTGATATVYGFVFWLYITFS